MLKKIILFLFVIILIFGGVFYPKKSHAIFGVVDVSVTNDPVHTAVNIAGWIGDKVVKAAEIALRAALSRLKKRLLDSITDQIIGWIQGNGSPKFVTDFEGVLEDSVQAAEKNLFWE